MAENFLLYGSYGYTGSLILELALRQGIRPLLGGRRAAALAGQAGPHGLSYRAFNPSDAAGTDEALKGVAAVLNCAGPFHRTALPIAQACLRAGAHYLDVTGEIAVFEALAAQDEAARRAQVMLLPGVGFDVVPTDCVAAHLKSRLPDANELVLAFAGGGGYSRGTATTMVESLHRGGAVRRNGVITRVPAGWKTREIDFGDGPVRTVTIPWGDVSTAFHTTGIGNIEVYAAMPPAILRQMRLSRYIGWLLASRPVQAFLKRRINAGPAGPSPQTRETTESRIWGQVQNGDRRATTRLRTPNGYLLTAMTALDAVQATIGGRARPGFQTPARVFGADFVLQFEGVRREDID